MGLYRDAAVYWHGTGLEADLDCQPEEAEHFGITIVEAMSAQCVPLAFNAGGPREFITHGVNGFLYGSREELAEMTCQLFAEEFAIQRRAIGRAAGQREAQFSVGNFIDKVDNMIRQHPKSHQLASQAGSYPSTVSQKPLQEFCQMGHPRQTRKRRS